MFEVNPNEIYNAKELIELSGKSKATIYRWFKNGLKHKRVSSEITTTGRAILDFFESQSVNESEEMKERLKRCLNTIS